MSDLRLVAHRHFPVVLLHRETPWEHRTRQKRLPQSVEAWAGVRIQRQLVPGPACVRGLHFPPRNAHVVQPGTTHLPPPWRMHKLLDCASVVHPGSAQGMLLCLLRMPPDFDTGLQPGGVDKLVSFTFVVARKAFGTSWHHTSVASTMTITEA